MQHSQTNRIGYEAFFQILLAGLASLFLNLSYRPFNNAALAP